jgi:hypothetical protein
VSADTIVPGAGNPQAFNRYAFVFNNPLKYVDPSGNVPCDPKKAKLCPTQAPKKSEPPDPCKTLGLCQPPTNPQFEAENEFELEMPATFSLAGPSIEMATSQKKGGGIRSKIGLMLSEAFRFAPPVAEWIRRVVCGGDCSDEYNNASQIGNRVLGTGRVINFPDPRQLQHVFDKHARAFGFEGSWNRANAVQFQEMLRTHVNAANTQAIEGTYRNTVSVIHYYDSTTGLNVMVDRAGNLVSAWRLASDQIRYLLTSSCRETLILFTLTQFSFGGIGVSKPSR